MSTLENYLRDLRDARATGEAVRETSFYPALSNLLNAVGAELSPKVRAVINLKNRGAGLPDGGLFTARQLKRLGGDESLRDPAAFRGQQPERGVVEVKGTGEDVRAVAAGEQVGRYLKHYGQVLVTNLREFLLVGREPSGAAKFLESYALAADEREFWRRVQKPREFAAEHGARLTEYLKRVMLAAAPLDAPESLAWFLASYARDARERVEREPGALESLRSVREALEQALGLRFEGEQGEQFFRSTLVQTLFYGVFSAWVLWSREEGRRRGERFDWRVAQWKLHVPAIRTLFEQLVTPTSVRGLGLEEILNWTADTLSRVEAERFFQKFERAHAVQYFYEPFLEAFDPELRKQLGVWYTPQEIVRYMVERTDRVLRKELKIERGLADERVYVLDPCCGTGAYLVEVLRRIRRTIDEEGGDALAADDLKRAATGRVYGFEILPAPFVVAHLQLGLLLQTEGSPLGEGERVGVYLTNALTGWDLRDLPPLNWPELDSERRGAGQVKLNEPILVVLGNPPYNAFAGVSPAEEEGLVELYKGAYFVDPKPTKRLSKKLKTPKRTRRYRLNDPPSIGGWGIKKFNLDELYIRFFRIAERRIAEKTGQGVVCYISNFSYLSDPSFVIMRERFLREFDLLWFDSLNGDSRETGKLTPEGKPDPSVFSTQYNREGIRVGTAIGLMARKAGRDEQPQVLTREFWGVTKRQDLLDSLDAADFEAQYTPAHPAAANRYSFRPSDVSAGYLAWPRLTEICAEPPSNGLMEKRGGALIDIDRAALEERMRMYFDASVDWATLEELKTGLTEDAARFDARKARDKVLKAENFETSHLRRYALRPFDTRWAYYSPTRPLWNEPRPSLWAQCWEGNSFLMSRPAGVANPEGMPLYFTGALGDNDALRGHAYYFPLYLRVKAEKKRNEQQSSLLDHPAAPQNEVTANLSPRARAYLDALGVGDVDDDRDAAALVWYHALAVGYSPAYLAENADGIRADFPRVPLPATREILEASAALGREVARLLDTEAQVPGVTTGQIRAELRHVANVRRSEGAGELRPGAGELELRAGWGHRGRGGVVMPGKGRLRTRDYTAPEREALDADAIAAFGTETHDVFLNDAAVWSNVPARVWDYHVGGYQVLKKWLSYREFEILGRSLTAEEAREVTQTARRIAAVLLLETRLDENYSRVKADSYAW